MSDVPKLDDLLSRQPARILKPDEIAAEFALIRRALPLAEACFQHDDNNKYSVKASAVGRPVDIHAYAERIVIKQDGIVLGEHIVGI